MFYVKIHKGDNNSVTAVCDKNIVGKTYRENDKVLNISEGFYKGRLVSEDELKDVLKNSTNINIVGKNSIDIAVKEGVVDKDSVLFIGKVPYAQVYYI
ncbi:MAG: DUF424 family protein [Nanoarchaeota archaeon]